MNRLKEQALHVIKTLERCGHQAYLVGGCVRDEWLGRRVKDYDIATSAKPEQVIASFERTVPTGLAHGTITVLIGGQPLEVTTFRKESDYADFRRPTEVAYIDNLREDLERRDFTMNAMAQNAEGALIDPFGGRDDLAHGTLCCVGQAEERFREDALRMLRGIRFAAEYGLRIEENTWAALMEEAPLLRHIAIERVRAELERMLAGSDPNRAFALAEACGAWQHTKSAIRFASIRRVDEWPDLRQLEEPLLRLAYVYVRLGTAATEAAADMRVLTFSTAQIAWVTDVMASHASLTDTWAEGGADEPALARRTWLKAALAFGREPLDQLLRLYAFDRETMRHAGAGEAQDADKLIELALMHGARWSADMPVARLAELAVSGKDVADAVKQKGGPWLGQLLNRLLFAAAAGELPNDRERLIAAAQVLYGNLQGSKEQ